MQDRFPFPAWGLNEPLADHSLVFLFSLRLQCCAWAALARRGARCRFRPWAKVITDLVLQAALQGSVPKTGKRPYWLHGTLSREEAEKVMDEWGGGVGTFLIRESGVAFVITRVGRSDADSFRGSEPMILHRKIDFLSLAATAGMYQMQSSRTAAPAFKTLVISTVCVLCFPACPSYSCLS